MAGPVACQTGHARVSAERALPPKWGLRAAAAAAGGGARTGLDGAFLDEQDERRAAQPCQQGQLHGAGCAEHPDRDQPHDQADERSRHGLRQPQQDLEH